MGILQALVLQRPGTTSGWTLRASWKWETLMATVTEHLPFHEHTQIIQLHGARARN